jgi:hypothetical protein
MVVKKKRMINGRSYGSLYKIRKNPAFFNTAFAGMRAFAGVALIFEALALMSHLQYLGALIPLLCEARRSVSRIA